MFSVHTAPEEFEKAQRSPVIFGFVFEKTRSGKSRGSRDVIVFDNLVPRAFSRGCVFENVFRPH